MAVLAHGSFARSWPTQVPPPRALLSFATALMFCTQMANTSATTAGASQLREGVDLSALNKSSAKVATFVVRLVNAKDVQYTYRGKRDGTQQTANKFEIVLVGMDPKSYCIGYVKGSEQDIVAARKLQTIRFGACRKWCSTHTRHLLTSTRRYLTASTSTSLP